MLSTDAATLNRASFIRRATGVLATEVAGEMVMMDVETGLYFGLDAIGTDIWNRLGEPVEVAALVSALGRDYDADVATIERDLLKLLDDMVGRGLVEIT